MTTSSLSGGQPLCSRPPATGASSPSSGSKASQRPPERTLACESDCAFGVMHLSHLVLQGHWCDAVGYVNRFLPRDGDGLSAEAQALQHFLDVHCAVADIVAGTKNGASLAAKYAQYMSHDKSVCDGAIRVRSIILNILHSRQHVRTSIDWQRVRRKASEIVEYFAYRTPELRGMAMMPAGMTRPHQVLPIGLRAHRRSHRKKLAPRPSAVAKCYLRTRRSLPGSSRRSQRPCDALRTKSKAMSQAAEAFGKTI
ncbi:hypothetical protein ACP70R_007532 [Stipagrostis hirtigluma subsp. patula]